MAAVSSYEVQAFSSLYSRLATGIMSSLTDIAFEAFSKKLISSSVKDFVVDHHGSQSKEKRANHLLETVLQRIKNIPSTFEEFATILESVPSLEYLAQEMKEKKNSLIMENEKINMLEASQPWQEVALPPPAVPEEDEPELCKESQPLIIQEKITFSQQQKSKNTAVCTKSVCTGLNILLCGGFLLLFFLFIFGIIAVISGIQNEKLCWRYYFSYPGVFTFLFGLMLVMGTSGMGLILTYLALARYSSCCNKRNKVAVTLLRTGLFISIVSLPLLCGEFLYSIFISLDFYHFYSNYHPGYCKDALHYITFTCLLLLYVPVVVLIACIVLFILLPIFVVPFIVECFREAIYFCMEFRISECYNCL